MIPVVYFNDANPLHLKVTVLGKAFMRCIVCARGVLFIFTLRDACCMQTFFTNTTQRDKH